MWGWVKIQLQVLSLIFDNILLRKHQTGLRDLWVQQKGRVFSSFPVGGTVRVFEGTPTLNQGPYKWTIH